MLNLAHRSIDPQIMPRENFFGVDPLKHQKPAKREEHGVDDAVADKWLTLKLRSMQEVRNTTWSQVADFARPGLKNDVMESRAAFLEMLKWPEHRQQARADFAFRQKTCLRTSVFFAARVRDNFSPQALQCPVIFARFRHGRRDGTARLDR